jgi:hypothetical protein
MIKDTYVDLSTLHKHKVIMSILLLYTRSQAQGIQRRSKVFSSPKNLDFFKDFSSHRILRYIHERLNINLKTTNYTVCL